MVWVMSSSSELRQHPGQDRGGLQADEQAHEDDQPDRPEHDLAEDVRLPADQTDRSGGAVSYTHLDVYKRQGTERGHRDDDGRGGRDSRSGDQGLGSLRRADRMARPLDRARHQQPGQSRPAHQ